jgi:hypothetical protein
MTNVVVVLAVLLLAGFAVSFVQRRRRSLVPSRGTSIGADLGALSDQPRVRVRDVVMTGADCARLVLTPETGPIDHPGLMTSPDLEFVVSLRRDDFGFELLQEWKRSASSIAMVTPPNSRLVRLRSIDDLQPLTLRLVDHDV